MKTYKVVLVILKKCVFGHEKYQTTEIMETELSKKDLYKQIQDEFKKEMGDGYLMESLDIEQL